MKLNMLIFPIFCINNFNTCLFIAFYTYLYVLHKKIVTSKLHYGHAMQKACMDILKFIHLYWSQII